MIINKEANPIEPKKFLITFEIRVNEKEVKKDMQVISEILVSTSIVLTLPAQIDEEYLARWESTFIGVLYLQSLKHPNSIVTIEYTVEPNLINYTSKGFGDRIDTPQHWTKEEIQKAQKFISS